nr:uncharacterized protein LOC111503828 [Leptinotarsa decemlineata]
MWIAYQKQLPLLEKLLFPRCLVSPNVVSIQMHGFCDASEKAYGACIYLRTTNSEGIVRITLVCSKSRVAPVSTVSLPRLELCAAALLAKNQPRRENLSLKDISEAHTLIIKLIQCSTFSKEINCLKRNESISTNSRLIPLNPYLDDVGLLRVGGRLQLSELPEKTRHPILLPSSHHVTDILIREEHQRLEHAGTQATLYSLRQTYWIVNGRNTVRKVLHRCIRCFRAKPRLADHGSGILPQARVLASRPFLKTGIDYCGPLFIKEKRYRNRNEIKVYVAIYVCMVTKAVHLELVCDLTTEAFLASLRRLFARRGKSLEIHSDNAADFVGANRELQELFESTDHKTAMQKFIEHERIVWHFIPPRAPHFGGLWEAAVKSFKLHLIRSVGDTLLTYDQLETYVVEIEAILNSRPLSAMSSDPNDLLPLTAGHFLIGGPLTSFPQEHLADLPANRLSAWQHAQKLKQHFWNRWHHEYLNNIISLHRQTKGPELQVGDLVIMHEDNLPPLAWAVGRIIATHPGPDGVIRVATVRTKNGEYKRCSKKLCPLPIE